jgi:hypothetical protein
MQQIVKYPRTLHIEGSKLQLGDEDYKNVKFNTIGDHHLVIEEKMDGANCAISFSDTGLLKLQSRGHYLTGGYRERHFAQFKTWANTIAYPLHEVIGSRYIIYGEWMYAKHTVFYTDLPHYFLEFDVFDQETETFLSTRKRHELLGGLPFMTPVRVLFDGIVKSKEVLWEMVEKSPFIAANHLDQMEAICVERGFRPELNRAQTDPSILMEGLYIKQENEHTVEARYKYVRSDFIQTILDSGTHWLDRPIIPNQLANGVDIFKI